MPSEAEERAHKRRALDLVLDAWEQAVREGAAPEVVASVAIYAALADMTERYGEDAVAEFCATLPERVRSGEFSVREKQ
ncbi:MAG TPA: hypothetical protein DHW63_03990 [Hyphomonadaceae bacterium]|nr:hypothetical protein [Hyphomonadaceae bacterium]